jgi:hypothetical protein
MGMIWLLIFLLKEQRRQIPLRIGESCSSSSSLQSTSPCGQPGGIMSGLLCRLSNAEGLARPA